MKRFHLALIVAALAGLIFPRVATSETWPSHPVKIVAPFPAGGSADVLGRFVAEHLSQALGQQFYVENRPGAAGVIGSTAVSKADPDGYTFLVSGIASHIIAPVMNPKTGYDPVNDFTHVAYIGGPPVVLIVNPGLGVKTFKEFLALAKSGKEKLGFVSPGVGSAGHLVMDALARKENFRIDHIPYKGASIAVMDLVAGHVKIGAMTWTTSITHIRSGKVLPIAVASARRMKEFPDVPTLKELGYPDLVATTWFSLSGPAGVPKDIVAKLNGEITKVLAKPEMVKQLEQDGIEVEAMSPEEFTKFVKDEIGRWGPIAKSVMQAKQ